MVNLKFTHLPESLLDILLLLASVNLLIVLLKGGYELAIGPFLVSAHGVQSPLLLWLAFAMVRVWLRGNRVGLPSSVLRRSPLLLFLIVVSIYSLNGRILGSGDTIPARYLPLSLFREFDFDLDEFPFLSGGEQPYFLKNINGRAVSTYPPWAAVLALPVYLLPVLGGISPQSQLLPELEKLAATLITALSVVFFYLAVRMITCANTAWVIACVYAFGTSSFSTSSQGLWQHGPAQLFLSLMIYWLIKGVKVPKFSAYAGFALAATILCRPMSVLIFPPVGAYILHKRRGQLISFLLSTFPPLILFMAYNTRYFGSPFSMGFASAGLINPGWLWGAFSNLFSMPLYEGLMGVLTSPSRGLFVYSPILLFAFVGMAMVWREPGHLLLKYLSLAPFAFILLVAKWSMWWGGGCYGPRLLADITPILCLFLYAPFERAGGKIWLKSSLVGLAALSIGLHALGAFGDGSWDGRPNVDMHPERLWSWVDSPPVYYGRQVFADLKQLALAMPSSLTAPQKLAASYDPPSLVVAPTLYACEFLSFRVSALNVGQAVWLAHAKDDNGAVRLGWRWFRDNQRISVIEGREVLTNHVFPGQRYMFWPRIAPPRESGQYRLEIGLVSEHVRWFEEPGNTPLKINIHALNSTKPNCDGWLGRQPNE